MSSSCRFGGGVRSPCLCDETHPEVHACTSCGHEVESARDPTGISGEPQHCGNTGMEVILFLAQVAALQTTHVQICIRLVGACLVSVLRKIVCRASVQVVRDAEDSETLSPVGSPAQLGWRIKVSLSNARQALEGDAIAPGNERTWKLLTDENRRPRSVREPLNRRIVSQDPPMPVGCRW